MDHFLYKNGVLHAEDVAIPDIVASVGAPFYVYSTATLTRHFQLFDDALADNSVPDQAQRELFAAKKAADRLVAQLEDSRVAFRLISHSLIRALQYTRGRATQNGLIHFYCPMVPGGGGDWLQDGTVLKNPYWGSQMLTCGELVRDLSLTPESSSNGDGDDLFEGLEVQTLDFED